MTLMRLETISKPNNDDNTRSTAASGFRKIRQQNSDVNICHTPRIVSPANRLMHPTSAKSRKDTKKLVLGPFAIEVGDGSKAWGGRNRGTTMF